MVFIDFFFQQQQRGRTAFLTGVAERTLQDVLDRQFTVCQGGDDGGVFATRFGHQLEAGLGLEHLQGSLCATGQDDQINIMVADELLTGTGTSTGDKLQGFGRHPRIPETPTDHPSGQDRVTCRLEDHRVSGRQSSGDAPAGNSKWKIPWADHHYDATTGNLKLLVLGEIGDSQRIEFSEVDRLAHLRISFDNRFAPIGDRRPDQVATPLSHELGRGPQDGMAFFVGP